MLIDAYALTANNVQLTAIGEQTDKAGWCNKLRISGIEEYWFCAEGEKDDSQ